MTHSTQPLATAIDAKTLHSWIQQRQALLIDVREAAEYATEHILGAQNLPLSSFSPDQIQVLSDRNLVLQCQSGRRSDQAAQQLLRAGFDNIFVLEGGLSAWKAASLGTIVDRNAPISLQRQVQIVAGSLVVLGTMLGAWILPAFLLLSGFVGAGLVFAGVSNTCMMAQLLAKLPYNRRSA